MSIRTVSYTNQAQIIQIVAGKICSWKGKTLQIESEIGVGTLLLDLFIHIIFCNKLGLQHYYLHRGHCQFILPVTS